MQDKIVLNEAKRIKELESYQILDTPAEQAYDDIIELASEICETPIALVSLIDSERQWFKSKIGIEVEETPRAIAFCAHAILQPNEIFQVKNAQTDERFSNNPLVTGDLHIRFYAGAPLVTESGESLGTLCVIDQKPRELTEKQKLSLRVLAQQVVAQLELRRTIRQMQETEARQKEIETALRESEARFQAFMNNSPAVAYMKNEVGRLVYVNKVFEKLFNLQADELIGKTDYDFLPAEVAAAVRKNDALVLSEWQAMQLNENVPSPDGSATDWLSLKFPFEDTNGEKYLGGVSIDITARKIAEEKLNASEQRYRHLFEFSPGFINVHNLEGVITAVNEAAAQSLGYQPEEVVGKSLEDFLIPAARPFFKNYLERLNETDFKEGVFQVQTKNGEQRIWQYRNRLYREDGIAPYIIGYAQDVTEMQQKQEELRSLSVSDDLTDLYNRRGFFALAGQALRYARRLKKECVLIYADLDGLKKINDLHGHATGSAMIVEAANIFKFFFRSSDIIARIGGDEFVFLIQDTSEVGMEIIKQRLLAQIEEFNRKEARPYQLSVSFGILAVSPDNPKPLEKLVAEADQLMYRQKQIRKDALETDDTADG